MLNETRKMVSPHCTNVQLTRFFFFFSKDLALINRAGGLYGRILTEVASTDRTQ